MKPFSSADLIRHYNQQFSSIRCASDNLFCNYCRKPGHIIVNCLKKAFKASSSLSSESTGAPKVSSPQSSPSVICFKCHAPGHISPNCPLNQPSSGQPAQANKINTVSAHSSCTVNSLSADPRTFVQILLNGQSFDALVDPGSALSFISKNVYDSLFSQPPLSTSIQCSRFFSQPPRSPI